jgi:hypothetical protein
VSVLSCQREATLAKEFRSCRNGGVEYRRGPERSITPPLNLASNTLLQIILCYPDILLRQLLNPFLLVDGEAAHYLAGGTQNQ